MRFWKSWGALKRSLFILVVFVGCGLLALHWVAGRKGIPNGWRPASMPPPHTTHDETKFAWEIFPDKASIDRPIQIRVSGLQPNEEVVFQATTADAMGKNFNSWARFIANDDGELDLGKVAPLEGSYQSADANGLLWSMRGENDGLFYSSLSWAEREVQVRMETSRGFEIKKLTRIYPCTGLECEDVSGSGIEGQLWFRESDQSLPVIIRLGGWGDGLSPIDSALLASKGYAVLDLAYHGVENLPRDLVRIPVETVSNAIDWLEEHPKIDRERIGIFGFSKGAELALLSAVHDHRISVVAAWAPPSVVFQGISYMNPSPGSSWTLAGVDVPFASASLGIAEARNAARAILGRPVSFQSTYLRALESASMETEIPVEKIDGPILLAAGTDDQMWPSSDMVRQIVRRLEQNSFPHEFESVVVKDAGHRLDYSLWPSGGGPDRSFVRGGDPENNHQGGQEAWKRTLAFFAPNLMVVTETKESK